MFAPASVAMRAAMIFVAMPPEPMSDPAAPAIASISFVIEATSGMNRAEGSSRGFAL